MRILSAALLSLALSVAPARTAPSALALAPGIAPAAQADTPRGEFHRQSGRLRVAGAAVLLSSSPDGTGSLCTDDEARLTVRPPSGPPQVWAHLFADTVSGRVVCIPPQRLALAGGPGDYEVELVLIDRFAPTYSSRPYLIIAEAPRPTAPAPLAGAVAPPPAASALVAAASVPTVTGPSPPRPAATPVPAPGDAAAAPGARWLSAIAMALAVAGLLIGVVLLRRRARPAPWPRLRGIVDLRDRPSGATRTLLLHPFPTGAAILRGPLGLAAPGVEPEREVATIRPGPMGPLLVLPGAETPIPLGEGVTLLIGQTVELRYRPVAPGHRAHAAIRRRT